MTFTETALSGLYIIEPKIFEDKRGYFMESYKKHEFEKQIGAVNFIQDNESRSSYGVLRGLHFQKPPFAQAKLVRCLEGEILDVAVDVRKDSPTFGKHFKTILSAHNKKQLFIPRGFAHGFFVQSRFAAILYKVDNIYAPEHDSGIYYNDPALGIEWPCEEQDIVISVKDSNLSALKDTDTGF